MKTIGIIGSGNLGRHLTRLMCRNKLQMFLVVSDIDDNRAEELGDECGVDVVNNLTNIYTSDVIFLATKPNHIKDVCEQVNTVMCSRDIKVPKLIVTAAAGVPVDKVKEWTKQQHRVVRCMPNIPISEGKGSIVWYPGTSNPADKYLLNDITAGPEGVWVPNESLMDPATVISGCSPAYVSKFFDTYLKIGVEMGFDRDQVKTLMLHSFEGTLELLRNMNTDEIMEQVASKGGATEKGLEQLDEDGFTRIVRKSAFSSLDQIARITENLE